MNMNIVAAEPKGFTDGDRNSFKALVEKGEEVAYDVLATNIENAKALVFGRIEGKVRGVAALKCPLASYRKRIEDKADFPLDEGKFPYELGYVFLAPEARKKGLSHCLIAAALEHAGGAAVFATARIDNDRMLTALAKAGFKRVGRDFPGRGTRIIRLLIRQPDAPA